MLLKSCFVLGLAATALAASGAVAAEHKEEPRASPGKPSPTASHVAPRAAPAPAPQQPLPPIRSTHRKRRTRRTTSSAFNPNDIDIGVKVTWCNDNTNFCQNVCLNKTWGAPINDGCDADSLNWHCTCGNGKNPDPDVYTFPVMLYECQYDVYQCQTNCATGDIRCTQECQSDRNCTAPNDPNNGKTAAPEPDDATSGLDGSADSDPVNFFSTAPLLSVGGYTALVALVAASVQLLGLP
ncbi:hypothetical protein IWQ57_000646 [Coemansia nantahalensis]|uniref:Uncharacterized protein n=2 Tax=Coemansia TaxID=4863 RepID=A0ACC1LC48_9FUNG|nr:hypothetical protein IWQ57_000646 [Coemansia nantahalensis]KAJ2805466.1 hypothetical protein H4R21_001247 [Coemansia helicoidea]